MTRLLLVLILLAGGFVPLSVHAMTEQPVQSGGGNQAQYTDPDEKDEQFNDAPRGAGQPSGREQQLLGSQNAGPQQTYGFGHGFGGYAGVSPSGHSGFYGSSSIGGH